MYIVRISNSTEKKIFFNSLMGTSPSEKKREELYKGEKRTGFQEDTPNGD